MCVCIYIYYTHNKMIQRPFMEKYSKVQLSIYLKTTYCFLLTKSAFAFPFIGTFGDSYDCLDARVLFDCYFVFSLKLNSTGTIQHKLFILNILFAIYYSEIGSVGNNATAGNQKDFIVL